MPANSRGWSTTASSTVALIASFCIVGLLSEVPATTLIIALLVIGSQVWIGSEVYRRFAGETSLKSVELIGLGFALGSFLSVIADQLFVQTTARNYWWWFVPLSAFFLTYRRLGRQRFMRPRISVFVVCQETALFSGLGLLILTHERYWTLWIAGPLLALSLSLEALKHGAGNRLLRSRLMTIASLIAIVLTTWRALTWRPPNWWIKTADIQFFEALGWSLAHFGADDQIFAAGIPMKYHWLSYAWTGMIDRITQADSWVVITRLAPATVAIALIPIGLTFARSIGLNGRWSLFGVVVFILLSDFNFESFSMVFSYVWLLAAAFSGWRVISGFSHSYRILFVLFSAAAFAAKSSNGVVIVGLLVAILASDAVLRKVDWRWPALTAGSTLVSIAATYSWMYGGSGYSQLLEIGISGFAQDLFGDMRYLRLDLQLLATIIVLANALLVGFLAATVLRKNQPSVALLLATSLVPSVVVLSLFVAPYHEQEEYFLHALIGVGSFPIALAVQHLTEFADHRSRMRLRSAAGASLVMSLLLVRLTPTNEGGAIATFARVILGSPVTIVFLIVGSVMLILRQAKVVPRSHLAGVLLICTLVAEFISLNDQWIRDSSNFKNEILAENHESRYLGNSDAIRAAELVRSHTFESDIIASNYFCETSWCSPREYSIQRTDWTVGGEALTLAMYSQRRYLVTGYGFTWQNIEPPSDVLRRIAWSLQPTPQQVDEITPVIPNFYLRDLTLPCDCRALLESEIVGEVDRFILYRL